MSGTWKQVVAGCAAIAALALAATPAATAKDGDVRVRGTCTKESSAKLKLSDEDGRIEVELEVDQNRVGVRWAATVRKQGRVVARTTKVTQAPSGSFTARVLTPNGPGTELLEATATSPSGEICKARASFA